MATGDPPAEAPAGRAGDSDAFFSRVYDELRAVARAKMRDESRNATLQTTELVHETYLRLRPAGNEGWASRAQFFAAAAEAMRRILIDRARKRSRRKRGGDEEGKPLRQVALDLEEVAQLADDRDPDTILALDDAIERLARRDERAAQVVRLRFYAGLSVDEVAETLGTSVRTVLRDWAFARVWLFTEISKAG
jgi:RNA polymerase sigma factor (TIGR02999 family)